MTNIVDWTLNAIREEDPMMSWMEERRFEWIPLVSDFVSKVISGTSIIVLSDCDRDWLSRYILGALNKKSKNRPYLPVISYNSLGHNLKELRSAEEMEILLDMLDISFKGEYSFWYIGKSNDDRFKLAKRKEDSFLWVLDEEIQNSFFMRSNDELLDIKLLHLIRLVDKTIDGTLFGDISLDG